MQFLNSPFGAWLTLRNMLVTVSTVVHWLLNAEGQHRSQNNRHPFVVDEYRPQHGNTRNQGAGGLVCYSCGTPEFETHSQLFDALYMKPMGTTGSCSKDYFDAKRVGIRKCMAGPCLWVRHDSEIAGIRTSNGYFRGCASDLHQRNETAIDELRYHGGCRVVPYRVLFTAATRRTGDVYVCVCTDSLCNSGLSLLMQKRSFMLPWQVFTVPFCCLFSHLISRIMLCTMS